MSRPPGIGAVLQRLQATAYGTSRASRPRAHASSFAAGAVSIATTVHGTPRPARHMRRPDRVTALIVQTPRPRSASDNRATRVRCSAQLVGVVGCRFSSFSRMSGNLAPSSSRTNGVRTMVPACAFGLPISRRVMGRTGSSTQHRAAAATSSTATPTDLNSVSSSALRRPDQHRHTAPISVTSLRAADDVADSRSAAFARVDEDPGGGDEIVVQLAPLGRVGPMALTWAPGESQRREEWASSHSRPRTTTSAPRTAASAVVEAFTPCRWAERPLRFADSTRRTSLNDRRGAARRGDSSPGPRIQLSLDRKHPSGPGVGRHPPMLRRSASR